MMAKAGTGAGRKPADTAHYAEIGYEGIWAAVRELQQFTLADLIMAVAKKNWSVNDETVRDYLRRLQRGGYLTVIKAEAVKGNLRTHTYELVNDCGVHAPRLTRDGSPSTSGMGRINMWRSMRILKEFDARDIAASASNDLVAVKLSEASDYIKHLHAAGYLKRVQAANHAGGMARYRLLPSMHTGPKPPQVQRTKRIFDPNLGRVVWREEEACPC